MQAERGALSELLDDVAWDGATVLLLGGGPDLERRLAERGAAEVHRAAAPGDRLAELGGVRLDAAVVAGALEAMRPTEVHRALAWIHERLRPGGEALVHARTWFAPDAAGPADVLATPLAHLLFPPRELDAHLAARGLPPAPYVNPSSATTYLLQLVRAGFELRDVRRHPTTVGEAVLERFAGKLSHHDPEELRTAALTARLRRPESDPPDPAFGDVAPG